MLIYIKWRDTENQQYYNLLFYQCYLWRDTSIQGKGTLFVVSETWV